MGWVEVPPSSIAAVDRGLALKGSVHEFHCSTGGWITLAGLFREFALTDRTVTPSLQYYHAMGRVEAFGRPLSAGEAARLRGWLAAQPRPPPAPGVVPQHAAVQVVQEYQQQQQQRRQHQQRHEPAAHHGSHHHHWAPSQHAGTVTGHAEEAAARADQDALPLEAGAARWQPGQQWLDEPGTMSPSGSSASSLSFEG